jgi:restriction system protein
LIIFANQQEDLKKNKIKMKNYYRIMLGPKSIYAEECYKGNFIGVDFDMDIDLTNQLPDNWREFNKKFIPVWMSKFPEKNKISAGLSCGALWTVAKGVTKGDIVLCPNGVGGYYVGEVMDNYSYHPNSILPHRRTIRWYSSIIERLSMSDTLKNSTGSIGTVSSITKHAEEIDILIAGKMPSFIISTYNTVEDPTEFALEKHLEDFLCQNWKQTELGKQYDIYEEDSELVGQQYPTDTGPIDILAIGKEKRNCWWLN